MVMITPPNDEGSAASTLEVATTYFNDALSTLHALKLRLKNGDLGVSPMDLARMAAEFRKATQSLLDERKKLEDQFKREAGVAGSFGFDLDAARDAIGRQLDRLRAGGSSGGVSG